MNCHDAESLLIAEKDGVLTEKERAVLQAHLADCKSCSKLQADLAAATNHFKESALAVTVPDAVKEWREVRARAAAPERTAPAWSRLLPAIGVPLVAAAALALAFIAEPQWFGREEPTATVQAVEAPQTAAWTPSAEFVEIPGSDDSPVVYVDEPSGWLVVWAVDPAKKNGS